MVVVDWVAEETDSSTAEGWMELWEGPWWERDDDDDDHRRKQNKGIERRETIPRMLACLLA